MRTWALLALFFLAAPAEAGLGDLCRNWFSALRPAPKALSPQESAPWQLAFGPAGTHPYLSEANLARPELFFRAWDSLPDPIRYRLLHLPAEISPYRAAEDLVPELTGPSFLNQILKKIDREGVASLEAGSQNFKKQRQDPIFAARTDAGFREAVENAHARRAFDTRAGERKLPLEESGGKLFLQVGPARYAARWVGNSLILEVPREKVAHPFWNPVAPEKVMRMAAAGVKPPKTYETLLGHDGKFYLADGNHRFDLDPKKTVSVAIAGPHTVNLRAMLDLIGAEQPDRAELINRYVRGETSWRELVPARLQSSFLIEPNP